jgi:hypothetical protein
LASTATERKSLLLDNQLVGEKRYASLLLSIILRDLVQIPLLARAIVWVLGRLAHLLQLLAVLVEG